MDHLGADLVVVPGGACPHRRRRTPAAGHPAAAVGARQYQGRRKKSLGFSRVAGRARLLYHRDARAAVGSCPAEMDGCDLLMVGWANFWPMRATRAGRLGSLPVGCWAASPGGRKGVAVGQFFLSGWKEMLCTVACINLFWYFFRSN
jgi:hypothetical protein